MKQEDKKPYIERIADCYREGSVLNMFYNFLAKKKIKREAKENEKK